MPYWSSQYQDPTDYPETCPGCGKTNWLDYDWETGLGYCHHCGWDKDQAAFLEAQEDTEV